MTLFIIIIVSFILALIAHDKKWGILKYIFCLIGFVAMVLWAISIWVGNFLAF